MRVAFVVPGGVDPTGTHEVIPCLLWLLERVARLHDVHVFAMRGRGGPGAYPLLGATVHPVATGGRGATVHPVTSCNGGATVPTFRALVANHRRDPFDLIHAFWASGPGVPAGAAGRLLRIPVLLHVTGGDLAAIPDIDYGGRRSAWGRIRVRFALAAATVRTAPSASLRAHAEMLGHPTRRLPLGVDRRVWDAAPHPRDPHVPARLVHVASLNRVKDQSTLLRALAHLAAEDVPVALDVVGADVLDGRVQAEARALGLDARVRFHGFLPQRELRPLVERAHVHVVSSRHEGDPIAMLEAAAVGVPTVGTAVGHLPDWASDAASAVPVGDDRALAHAIRDLLADETRRLRMARAARTRALAEDADWTAARVLEMYEELAGAGMGSTMPRDGTVSTMPGDGTVPTKRANRLRPAADRGHTEEPT